jgi:L-threonylcarbamoyladenylate synthase
LKRGQKALKKIEIANTQQVSPDVIAQIADTIKKEQTVLLPAKTIYGISCAYASRKACQRVAEMKKRDADMPFIVLISEIGDLAVFTDKISPEAKLLIERYWAKEDIAPLTLIFQKKSNHINDALTKRNTVAVRIAEFSFVREAIKKSSPIISTSATISTIKSFPLRLDQVPRQIIDGCDLVIDVREALLGVESTIVDVSTEDVRILREGAVKSAEIHALF